MNLMDTIALMRKLKRCKVEKNYSPSVVRISWTPEDIGLSGNEDVNILAFSLSSEVVGKGHEGEIFFLVECVGSGTVCPGNKALDSFDIKSVTSLMLVASDSEGSELGRKAGRATGRLVFNPV